MKHFSKAAVAFGLAALMSSTALADIKSTRDMKNGTQVSVTGTVEKVKNEREFTLRDSSGSIDVDIQSSQSVVLKQGDTVSVNGTLNKGLLGTDINANRVSVDKNLVKAIGDTIEGNTTISLEGANSYNISSLPREGLVKVSGTVTDVDNEKSFTVKDSTGSIDIDVESAETAALTKGAEVTVIGYVDQNLLGKDINARKVLVVADAGANR